MPISWCQSDKGHGLMVNMLGWTVTGESMTLRFWGPQFATGIQLIMQFAPNLFTQLPVHGGMFSRLLHPWASYQIRKIADCECAANVGNVFHVHHGTCMTHVLGCLPGSLTGGFFWSQWRGKRSRHSRRMRNLQILVSGKRPIQNVHLLPSCRLILGVQS